MFSALQLLTLPTLLTLVRVAAVPALVAAWYSPAPWAGAACMALFLGASLTDWLDGYLARKLVRPCSSSSSFRGRKLRASAAVQRVQLVLCTANQHVLSCAPPPCCRLFRYGFIRVFAAQNASSAFGAFLDPVADKLMVASVMVLLCTRPLPPACAAALAPLGAAAGSPACRCLWK